GPAARPRDTRVAPTGDDDITIPKEAEGPVAAPHQGRSARAEQQLDLIGVHHGSNPASRIFFRNRRFFTAARKIAVAMMTPPQTPGLTGPAAVNRAMFRPEAITTRKYPTATTQLTQPTPHTNPTPMPRFATPSAPRRAAGRGPPTGGFQNRNSTERA